MTDYKPFPISNFRTGFNEAVEPWLPPRDSFQVMTNANLYRGVLEKVTGYDLFTRMSYRRMISLTGTINGVNKTFTGTLNPLPTTNNFEIQAAINAAATLKETFTDNGAGVLTGSNGGTGSINYSTGAVSVTFGAAAPANITTNAVILSYDAAGSELPIMGIKPYINENGTRSIMIFDTRRVGKIVPLSDTMGALQELNYGVSEIPHEYVQLAFTGTGAATVFTGTLGTGGITPGTVTITQYTAAGVVVSTITDSTDAAGALIGTGVTSGFINYFTGQYTITFGVAPTNGNVFNASFGVFGNVFSGTFSNFFSLTNYQSKAFFTNSIDPPMYYDGLSIHYLNTNLTTKLIAASSGVPAYDLTRVLHVETHRERLLLMAPTVEGVAALNSIYWSTAGAPLNFTNAEFLFASTSQPIRTYALINSDLVVRFSTSERIFRYTGDAFAPFRWDLTNNMWACDAPYSAINYDSYFSSVGKPAIVASDGVNVKRADEIIPDFTDPYRIPQQTPALFLDQTSIRQCYGERFDDLKQGWLCYKSSINKSETLAPSDAVLSFSYLDNTYATYKFPFSCLGFGSLSSLQTWGSSFNEWGSAKDTWGSYQLVEGGLVDLAGDQSGNVFRLSSAYTLGSYKTGSITAMTNASPCQLTSAAHKLASGDQVTIQGIVDAEGEDIPEINNVSFVVTVIDANNFTIPLDTSLLPAYGSGGTWFTSPVTLDVVTKNFNPFIEDGQLARLGFVDFLVSSNDNTTFRVQFYTNDRLDADFETYYQETPLTLTATGQTKVWKRVYVGAVGKEHTLRFYQNLEDFTSDTVNQPVRIHAFVLYFAPAGRIFN